jgi:hypothetical protein
MSSETDVVSALDVALRVAAALDAVGSAPRSRLEPFVKLAKTVREHAADGRVADKAALLRATSVEVRCERAEFPSAGEEGHRLLRRLIGLREHRSARLREYLVLALRRGLVGDVDVADAAVRCG